MIKGAILESMLKQCSKCKVWKETSEFAFKDKKKGKLKPSCRACDKRLRKRVIKIITCAKCHQEKPHNAHGLCHTCYSQENHNRPDFHSPPPETKRCFKCKVIKPINQFHKHAIVKDGFDSWCKECNATREQIIGVCKQCGRTQKVRSGSLCGSCINKKRKPKIGICIKCHKEKDLIGKGVCQGCLTKKRYHRETSKILARRKEIDKQNPEKVKAYNKKRYWGRIPYERKRKLIYNITHKEQLQQYQRDYIKKNPYKIAHWVERRRARDKNLPHTLTDTEWEETLKEQNYVCYYCGNPPKKKMIHEHSLPQFFGGGYTKENIRGTCEHCNAKKHMKTEAEYIAHMRANPDEFPDAKWIR